MCIESQMRHNIACLLYDELPHANAFVPALATQTNASHREGTSRKVKLKRCRSNRHIFWILDFVAIAFDKANSFGGVIRPESS